MFCHFPLNLGERLLETGRPPLVQNPIESDVWLRASFLAFSSAHILTSSWTGQWSAVW
ncbi:uncharacterized protein TrAFT101_001523 [Trichoderma asperellum]|uniref:uncharacterized protein n=1 Tax=Trichoderma asperellum TaxID=101201 RepID=UPI003323FC48|nr:hypothetical protein TrAFT101_001523 [Trichoderma asperellum]